MKREKPPPPTATDAGFEILKLNANAWDWRDLYHWLLTLNWPRFAAFLLASYVSLNLFFATLYCLGGACIDGMPPGSFASAFFFSVETLATVGYGHMYPATPYGHIVATLEIMVGMFGTAVMTGLIFVRFSRPAARLLFSRVLVISNYDGRPALMVRIANQRNQPMVRAEFKLMMLHHKPTLEDETMRRFYVLPLVVNHMVIFPAAITIRHMIDEHSPLHGATIESLEKTGARFMASVECVDKIIQAPVQSEQTYNWRDVRIGERFAEIYSDEKEGRLMVDYAKLHDTEPAFERLPAASAGSHDA